MTTSSVLFEAINAALVHGLNICNISASVIMAMECIELSERSALKKFAGARSRGTF